VDWERVETMFPQLFALVTLLEDLDFSFQFLCVVPGAAQMNNNDKFSRV